MKNIKELGLELIELEDQVLLVESKVGGGKLNDWVKLSAPKIERVEEWNKDLVLFCNKVIASTKPLEGLPLLVIEDEVEKMAKEYTEKRNYLTEEEQGFVDGYNHAKSTYKFTEDDLRKALSESFKASQEGYQITSDEIIQSLSNKELWIEVEDVGTTHYIKEDNNGFNDVTGINFHKYEWIPKITNNKIHAVWK